MRFAGDVDEIVKRIARPGAPSIEALVRTPAAMDNAMVVPPREAFLGPAEIVPVDASIGRVSCESIAGYPPGIPALLPGERLTADTVAYLASSRRRRAPARRGRPDVRDHLRAAGLTLPFATAWRWTGPTGASPWPRRPPRRRAVRGLRRRRAGGARRRGAPGGRGSSTPSGARYQHPLGRRWASEPERLRVDLGDDARVEGVVHARAALAASRLGRDRACGLGARSGAVLHGTVPAGARRGGRRGRRRALAARPGATAYAEKNPGARLPRALVVGRGARGRTQATVAFAGGPLCGGGGHRGRRRRRRGARALRRAAGGAGAGRGSRPAHGA